MARKGYIIGGQQAINYISIKIRLGLVWFIALKTTFIPVHPIMQAWIRLLT
jgi:hypothetical protein